MLIRDRDLVLGMLIRFAKSSTPADGGLDGGERDLDGRERGLAGGERDLVGGERDLERDLDNDRLVGFRRYQEAGGCGLPPRSGRGPVYGLLSYVDDLEITLSRLRSFGASICQFTAPIPKTITKLDSDR
jgi:hypothetical protein